MFKPPLEDPTRYQRVHPENGQAHRGRMNCHSVQRATTSQARSSSTQAQRERFFYSSERDQESCDLKGRCGTTHSLLAHHWSSFAMKCTTYQSCLQHLLLRCHFLRYFVVEIEEHGSSPILDALKCTSLSRHTCHRSSFTSRILTAHFCTRDLSHCY